MEKSKEKYVNEYGFINSLCDSMNPADILLSLVLECPHSAMRIDCPINEMSNWRKMGLKDAQTHICSMTLEEQKELVEQHRTCSCSLIRKDNRI